MASKKGSDPNSAQHPSGRSGYWGLTPFSFPQHPSGRSGYWGLTPFSFPQHPSGRSGYWGLTPFSLPQHPSGRFGYGGLTPFSLRFRLIACFVAMLAVCPLFAADPIDQRSRGDVPDPFLEIWDRAVAAMDQTYGDWNKHADLLVESTEFAIEYLSSVYPESSRRLDASVLMQADQNRDKWISRVESKRFLEIQLGIRWETDDLLRLGDGRVVDFDTFITLDANQDSKLSADEVSQATFAKLAPLDQDANDIISLAEYSHRNSPFLRDPIEEFHSADANSDNQLDANELAQSTPSNRIHLIEPNLAAFDENQDQQLSLTEYRVSMLGNFNYPWQTIPADDNRDRKLSFNEFRFGDRSLFQLQRRFYFHRLDLDRDGALSLSEFPFETVKIRALVRMSADGSEQELIFSDDDYPMCGAPDISHDGRSILFHAGPMQSSNQSVIRVMTIDGTDARDVCDGSMPTWSPDGSRFSCSRYDGVASVWIMRLDGSVDTRIDDGWGAPWSPDGASIAYTKDNSVLIYDVKTGRTSVVLAKGTHPYRYISGNLAWSPDSRRLVFKGKLSDEESEVAVLDVTTGILSQLFKSSQNIGDDFAWLPDASEILFPLVSPKHGRSLIHRIDLVSKDPPRIDTTIGDARQWTSVCVDRQGKWLILATDTDESSASGKEQAAPSPDR